jgi:hypothetical protein
MARYHPRTPKLVVESQEVCIAFFFVGFLVENWVDLGGDSGGLGLKETRSFVDSSTETYAPLWC